MRDLDQALEELRTQFIISPEMMNKIAVTFQEEMVRGLTGKDSSLKMLPSYLNNPTGQEKGSFLALDFGGTNLRVLLVDLLGQGNFRMKDQISFRFKDGQKGYDYTSASATAEELFDFIAANIAKLIDSQVTYHLGHTFSFPFRLEGRNTGILINWTKEFRTTGVEGQNITELLRKALVKQSIHNVIPQAILNDTVGTQLARAYGDSNCRIGSIIGTGHNSCYLEKDIIINMESGNFNLIPQSKYDKILDENSEQPGSQLLEKMVSGRYIGEIVRLIILELADQGFIFSDSPGTFQQEDCLTGEEVSKILEDGSKQLSGVEKLLAERFSLSNSREGERKTLQEVCALVLQRSAVLIAATYLGTLKHLNGKQPGQQTIAIDGSLFERMPGYAQVLQKTLGEALEKNSAQASLCLTKDGSGIGAAIAAAVSNSSES